MAQSKGNTYHCDQYGNAVTINREHCDYFQCDICHYDDVFVPTTCPYAVLQMLSTGNTLLKQCPRRSGKTTKIIHMATRLSMLGNKLVYIVTMNERVADNVAWMFLQTKTNPHALQYRTWSKREHEIITGQNTVKIISKHQVMHEQKNGLYLTDELLPNEVREIKTRWWPEPHFKYYGGYYT